MTKEEIIELLGKGGINVNGDLVIEKHVEHEIGNVEAGGIGIQINNTDTRSKTTRQKKQGERKTSDKPKTLKYYTHGNNGILMKQRKRVDIIYRKFIEWGWIVAETNPDDFDSFFEGEPRHCNITWTGNTTILTILLQELIKQPYIQSQTRCSAKSLVEQQFGKTANSDRSRLDIDSENKIIITLQILDIRNPLPERNGRSISEEEDTSDAALQEIFAGQLRSTKGI